MNISDHCPPNPANAYVNNYVQLFNNRLKPLMDDLNANLPGAKFTFVNVTSISLSLDVFPLGKCNNVQYDITISEDCVMFFLLVSAPYCVVSAGGQCVPNEVPCSNMDQYIFYDKYHPQCVINQATAARSYNAISPSDASPFDINQLAQQ